MRIVLVLLTLVAPLAFAQSHARHGRGAAPGPDAGARPGDDALTCEQLLAEMGSITSSPGMQNLLAQQQAMVAGSASEMAKHPELLPKNVPQGTLDNLNQLAGTQADPSAAAPGDSGAAPAGAPPPPQPETPRRPGIGKIIGQGLLSNFGGGRAAAAEQQRELEKMAAAGRAAQEAQQPAIDAAQAQVASQGPQMERGMHLAQLAEAKGCAQQAPPQQGAH
ncbi:MAG TPA: hypothetical protein VHH11_03870 [Gammaproteobacteria bacterium]|jgi:hypothetical protein|nr:hypothetical protein [Gammaproteobacteria bacterium]